MTILNDGPLTRPALPQGTLAASIRRTVAYGDVFDWPLTVTEIHRFLPEAAAFDAVRRALEEPADIGLVRHGELVALAGRAWLFDRRRRLAQRAARRWPAARFAARAVAALPFVQSVSISGSLAVDVADEGGDVDLFVVTAPGRLWLARAATLMVGRVATLAGIRLCPNYLLSERALALPERDPFTARELAQLVPVSGYETYRQLLSANAWYRDHTPNHVPTVAPEREPSRVRRWIERALGIGLVDRLERWEMARKIARFQAAATSAEQRFDADTCKGHFDEHRRRTLARYRDRLNELGLAP